MTPRATRRAALLFLGLELAAGAPAWAAEPFPVVPEPPPERQSHLWAYTSMVAGAGLIHRPGGDLEPLRPDHPLRPLVDRHAAQR